MSLTQIRCHFQWLWIKKVLQYSTEYGSVVHRSPHYLSTARFFKQSLQTTCKLLIAEKAQNTLIFEFYSTKSKMNSFLPFFLKHLLVEIEKFIFVQNSFNWFVSSCAGSCSCLSLVSCWFVIWHLIVNRCKSWLWKSFWEMKNWNFLLQFVLNLLHGQSLILGQSVWEAKSLTNKKNQKFGKHHRCNFQENVLTENLLGEDFIDALTLPWGRILNHVWKFST